MVASGERSKETGTTMSREIPPVEAEPYDSEWIFDLESIEHFSLYHRQAQHVFRSFDRSDAILEVGPGTNLLRDILVRRGFNVKTLDIDANKKPDFQEPLAKFQLTEHNFCGIIAFEVFEHVPLEDLDKFLRGARKSGVKRIIFSVPFQRFRVFDLRVRLPRGFSSDYSLWFPRRRVAHLSKYHHWELGMLNSRLPEEKQVITREHLEKVFRGQGYGLDLIESVDIIDFFVANNSDMK